MLENTKAKSLLLSVALSAAVAASFFATSIAHAYPTIQERKILARNLKARMDKAQVRTLLGKHSAREARTENGSKLEVTGLHLSKPIQLFFDDDGRLTNWLVQVD